MPMRGGLLRASFAASLLALAGAALLFPLIPRYEAGLLGELSRRENQSRISGFSERVRFGEINGIKNSGEVVFRAHVSGRDPAQLRWRAPWTIVRRSSFVPHSGQR